MKQCKIIAITNKTGIDIAAPQGTPVLASASGTVSRVQYLSTGYGNHLHFEVR